MFEGDGFGVGLTVSPIDPALSLDGAAPDGVSVRPSRLTEVLPPESRSRAGQAAELGRVQRQMARLLAYQAALVVRFAANCPATGDTVLGEPGAAAPDWAPEQREPDVSEFFVDELAAALGTSVTSASREWLLRSTLFERLPGTWAAMADGELDVPRGRAIAAEVAAAPGVEPMVLMAVEAAVLPRAGS